MLQGQTLRRLRVRRWAVIRPVQLMPSIARREGPRRAPLHARRPAHRGVPLGQDRQRRLPARNISPHRPSRQAAPQALRAGDPAKFPLRCSWHCVGCKKKMRHCSRRTSACGPRCTLSHPLQQPDRRSAWIPSWPLPCHSRHWHRHPKWRRCPALRRLWRLLSASIPLLSSRAWMWV